MRLNSKLHPGAAIVALLVLIVIIAACCSGCATYQKNEDGSYTSYGFLRTLTVKEKFYESGELKERTISTQSNTGEVLLGMNEIIKTGVDYAGKVK